MDNHSAALLLRDALVQGLPSVDASEPNHRALRDQVVRELAEADGAAVESFGHIFRYVSCQASMLYGDRWPGVRFQIAARTAPFYRENSKIYVNASTDLRIGKPNECPVVRVSIFWEQFNWQTYAAVFALLVHESVCHVASPRVEYANPNGSAFAEGFADWAAEKLFERWLSGLDVKLSAAARQFGRELWLLGLERGGGNDDWKARFVGRTAAENALSVMIDAGIPEALAVDRLRLLVRELTVLNVDLELKDVFVGNLGYVGPVMRERLVRWGRGGGSVGEMLLPLE